MFDASRDWLVRLRDMQRLYRSLLLAALVLGMAPASHAASIFVSGSFQVSLVQPDMSSAFVSGDVFDFTWELDGSRVDSDSGAGLEFEDVILSAHFTRRAGNVGTYDPSLGDAVTYSIMWASTTMNQYLEVLMEIDDLPSVSGEGVWGVHGVFYSTNGGFFKSGMPNTGTTLAQALNGPLALGDVTGSFLGFYALSEDGAEGPLTALVPEPGVGAILGLAGLAVFPRRRR